MTAALPAADTDEPNALVLHTGGDPLDRAVSWTHLPPDERRRRAVAACHMHNARRMATWTRPRNSWTIAPSR